MKIVPSLFECEICRKRYDRPEDAFACESTITPVYPVGMIFGDHRKGSMYYNITFAIGKIHICSHSNYSGLWACRDNGAGDTLGKELCGNNDVRMKPNDAPNPSHPTFKRMVKKLKSQGIKITVWDGKNVVSLKDFLRGRK